jgi:hypothetical protein
MSASQTLAELSSYLTVDGRDPLSVDAFADGAIIAKALVVVNALPEIAALTAAAEAQDAWNIANDIGDGRKAPMALHAAVVAVNAKLSRP